MPERHGRRVFVVGLLFALTGSAWAEPPTPTGAKKVETEKKRYAPPADARLPHPRVADIQQPDVAVRLLDQQASGWSVAETDHFRVYYTDKSDQARKAAIAAEHARDAANHKWLSDACPDWDRRCEIFIYITGRG